jgi:hypothetical protein
MKNSCLKKFMCQSVVGFFVRCVMGRFGKIGMSLTTVLDVVKR